MLSFERETRSVPAATDGSSPEQRASRRIRFVPGQRAIPSGAPRKSHTLEIRHLARSIPDVGSEDRCESVAAVLHRCGLLCEPWPLVRFEIQVCRGMVNPRWNRRVALMLRARASNRVRLFRKKPRPCSRYSRRRVSSIILRRCWCCSSWASSPLCVRVGVDIAM